MSADAGWRSGTAPGALAARARMLAAIRGFMADEALLEVDTPVLSGAAPSERALECLAVAGDGYLVPSPEHALKRLLAEGVGSLYQLGHVFRAGETGRWHNPEFTMLEWYGAGEDMPAAVERLMRLLEHLGVPAPMRPPRRYRDVFEDAVGLDPLVADTDALAARAVQLGVAPRALDAAPDRVFWLDLLMAMHVQPRLGGNAPEIVTHFPADDAVLVASDPDDARQALRFECFWQGVELANGARELTDVETARHRMAREQSVRRREGRAEPPIDEALLSAMAAGLPACAGVALGVDRLLALLTGAEAIAAVLPFARR